MLAPTVFMIALALTSPSRPPVAPGVVSTIPQPPPRTPQTDQTVDVAKGTRLKVENYAGEVQIRVWSRDAVRVQAHHAARVKVEVGKTPAGFLVRAPSTRRSVDYEITVPAWMPVSVTGTYNFVTVEGAQSEVSAETTRGDIIVRGGTGAIVAKSIQGQVIIEGARGRITASSVSETVRITDATGDITADTTNGDVILTQIKSSNADVTTVDGDIRFEGPPASGGRYRLTTHNGDIMVAVPETASVTFIVRSYKGTFASALTLAGPPRSEARQGRRLTYTLGGGSAQMEMETFGGDIRVRKPGTPPATGKDKAEDAKARMPAAAR